MFRSYLSTINRRPLHQWYLLLENGNRPFASFNARDVIYERSDEAGTLLTRFAKHVAIERTSICEQVPTKVRYADYFPITEIKYFQKQLADTSVDQLAPVIVFAFSYRSNAEPHKFASILNEIDRYATSNVRDMDVDTILRTLYAFLFLIPNWMTRLDFHTAAMQQLVEMTKQSDSQSKELFVQMCFYFGLSKKQLKSELQKSWKDFLNSNLDRFLSDLSLLDLTLVSNAAFKTSTLIDSKDFNQRLIKEVLAMSSAKHGQDAIYITLIKSLRFQRVQSREVCQHLNNICSNTERLLEFQTRGQAHMFAYLADNLWDCDTCTRPLVDEFLGRLKSANFSTYAEAIRGKDIARFLWCCAQLNCDITKEQFRVLEEKLVKKVHNKEFNYFPDQLVESCLSLWILGFKSKELLQYAIQLKSEFPSKRQQPKVDSRLTVLLSAAQIEEPTWCTQHMKGFVSFNQETKVPGYLLNSEVPYQGLISQLNQNSIVTSASVSNPINGINIPGILIKLSSSVNSTIFLEFMTQSQMLKFRQQPMGILRLKFQLLQHMGYRVKVLSSSDFSEPLDLKIVHDENRSDLTKNILTA